MTDIIRITPKQAVDIIPMSEPKTIEFQFNSGIDGKDGRDGTDGAPGRDGIDGTNGQDGAPGRDGTNGTDGKPGTNGKDGTSGVNGKSAYELAVIGGYVGTIEQFATEAAALANNSERLTEAETNLFQLRTAQIKQPQNPTSFSGVVRGSKNISLSKWTVNLLHQRVQGANNSDKILFETSDLWIGYMIQVPYQLAAIFYKNTQKYAYVTFDQFNINTRTINNNLVMLTFVCDGERIDIYVDGVKKVVTGDNIAIPLDLNTMIWEPNDYQIRQGAGLQIYSYDMSSEAVSSAHNNGRCDLFRLSAHELKNTLLASYSVADFGTVSTVDSTVRVAYTKLAPQLCNVPGCFEVEYTVVSSHSVALKYNSYLSPTASSYQGGFTNIIAPAGSSRMKSIYNAASSCNFFGFTINGDVNKGTLTFSDFTIRKIGAVAYYDGRTMTPAKIYDHTDNEIDLTGTITLNYNPLYPECKVDQCAPNIFPQFYGQQFFDSALKRGYIAARLTSLADWKQITL